MENQFCSICLITESRLFLFRASEHKTFIKNIIRKSGHDPMSHDNEHICFVCKSLLLKSYNFIQKAMTAHLILENLLKETDNPKDVIKVLDRNEFDLNTLLTIHKNDIDFHFTEDTDIGDIDYRNVDIKVENAFNDDLTIEDEDKLDIKPLMEYSLELDCDVVHIKQKKAKKRKKKSTQTKKSQPTESKKPVKRQTIPSVPSVFMQSLPLVSGKRARKEVKYDKMDVKNVKGRHKNDDDDEYNPGYESSDTSFVDLYNEAGQGGIRDLRVFPMTCEECPVEILNKREHHYHYLEVHRDVPYPYRSTRAKDILCQICGKAFTTASRYNDHMKTHTAERKESCNKCNKKFVRRAQLLKHLRRHDENVKYECDVCKKIFKTRLEMRTHIRIHSGDKPYKCHICGAGFAHNGNVGVHIRSKHQHAPSAGNQNKVKIPKNGAKPKLSSVESGEWD